MSNEALAVFGLMIAGGLLIGLVQLVQYVRALRAPAPQLPDGFRPYVEGEIPPPGWVLVEVEGGGKFWADPAKLQASGPKTELTEQQKGRIQAFKAILGENDPTPLEQTYENFSRDRDPEREIAVWERIAYAWSAELQVRGLERDTDQARLLYVAVLGCTLVGPSEDALLSWNPNLKALPDLPRVVGYFRAG